MNYGKLVDGALHVYGAPGPDRKELRDRVPEGYQKEECRMVPGGYKDLGDAIGIEYVYVAPGRSLTEQRLDSLEAAQATTEQAVQDLILTTFGGEA